MQNTIVIWKNIASDPSNASNMGKRIVTVYPKDSKSDKLLKGLTAIEKNMGIDELNKGERLPVKISKDKKGLIIKDTYFVYMFYGSKDRLSHKERIMNQVLQKCSQIMTKESRNMHFDKSKLNSIYEQVAKTYTSTSDFHSGIYIYSHPLTTYIPLK